MAENNSTFQNTETFLIECSRANSLVDSNDGADFNAKWLTSTNFNLRRGDQVSVEMMALNAKGAGGGNVIEFTGDNVSIDGKDKPYCDNKVLLEVFFYLNNNNTYNVGLPLIHPQFSFDGSTYPENKNQPVVYGTTGTNRRGYTFTAGSPSFLVKVVLGVSPNQYVGVGVSAATCHAVAAFNTAPLGQTPLWATSVGGGVNITSVVLEQAGDPGTSLKTDYASWYGGKNGANQLCNFLPGMRWGIEDINNVVNQNAIPFGSFVEQTAAMPALPGYAGSGRLIIYFSQAVTLSTSTVAQGALIGASWTNQANGTSEIGIVDYNNINQGALQTFPPYIAKNKLLGHYMENIGYNTAAMAPQFKYWNNAAYGSSAGEHLISVAKENQYDPQSNKGFRCGNPRQNNNGKPYILSRNDWAGQGRRSRNTGNFLPQLEPLSAFILLEADELFTDVTSLAQKINDKLHETLNIFDTEIAEQDNYLTNDELYPNSNTKSSSILPLIQNYGYVDPVLHPTVAPLHKTLWDTVASVKFGGTCKIQPANFDDGVNYLEAGKGLTAIDELSDKYLQTTYIQKCPNPTVNVEKVENPIYGNCGYLDFYKAQLGDRWQRMKLHAMDTVLAGPRNVGKPILLNTKLNFSGNSKMSEK